MEIKREILVAEDNPADVRLIQEALRALDPPPHVSVARDGDEALRFLRRSGTFEAAPRPEMVFLDFHLPKRDPREVLTFIKTSQTLRNVAVVVLTTSDGEELAREAYGLGADCYLSKPSDLDGFMYTIRAAASYWLRFPTMK